MAILTENNLLKGLTGHIGKKMVFKQYGDKTVVTAYPNMSKVKKSKLQTLKQGWFKDAVAYAQNIIRDPKLKQEYLKRVKKSESVYHYAIKEYLERFKQV